MILNFVNETEHAIPRQHLLKATETIVQELKKRKIVKSKFNDELTLVFLKLKKARSLNNEFRGKDYATDVLSFESIEEGSLGELILCPEVLKKQASEHQLSYKDELTYMVLHGILHLLGYDHEQDPKEAQRMYSLQDSIFAILRSSRA